MLAKELGVTSKAILEKCRKEGLSIKNHMSVLSAGQEATIREWFSEGEHTTTLEQAERVDLEKVKKVTRKRRSKKKEEPAAKEVEKVEESSLEVKEAVPVVEEKPAPVEVPVKKVKKRGKKKAAEVVEEQAEVSAELPEVKIKEEPKEETKEKEEKKEEEKKEPVKPAGPVNVPAPAVLSGPKVVRVESPTPPKPTQVRPKFAKAEKTVPTDREVVVETTVGKPKKPGKVVTPKAEEEELTKKRRAKAKTHLRKGRGSRDEALQQIREWRDRDLIERSQRLALAADHPHIVRKVETRKKQLQVSEKPKGKVKINEPIILKEFCAATGIPFSKLFPKLMEHNLPATINQTISAEDAELLAIDFGIELEVVRRKSRYEELIERYGNRERKNPKKRWPIVTFLGHVDHGKTSLLDRIRNTRITETEAGGITQHIGAYRYPLDEGYIVFLDTPGHEAFTSLRARGAQITDIVVLVVAADDGVMPQTIEAISHAKAANVPIVVALNKIDLPNIDENRVLGQLAEQGLVPAEWGGETDVIKTSAITGEGIEDLIEHLHTLAELMDLQADPTLPAMGVVLESRHDSHRGPIANLIVQDGTLKRGDVVVVGKAYGRVRAMRDDFGKNITEAEPSTPIEMLGLNDVPEAGEKFYVVDDLGLAQEIADEKRAEDKSRQQVGKPRVTLENIFQQVEAGEIRHLNLIVKADTQGSLDALNKKLAEIGTSEVQVKILHSGIGGITEGDVILADASQAIIIGFCVVPDEVARVKAQEFNVEIRTYTVIYHLLEDITSALEGLLEPTYEQKVIGRAVVKETFRISRVGTVAGCMVTEGVIERSAKVRIIRQNVILKEEATIESLKRFKDDVREVRSGFECGIKIANFDDIKEGDVIEAYKIEEIKRTLQTAEAR